MKKLNIKTFNRPATAWLFLVVMCSLCGCKKFLDAKPDKQLATPTGLSDLTAILDADNMNIIFPSAGDMASDDYFLPDATWSSLSQLSARLDYTWDASAANDQDWQYGYSEIENTNVVLDGLSGLAQNSANAADFQNTKGMACFFRGFTLAQLANVFTLPYDAAGSNTLPGLPLRLTSDITAKVTRSTMAATYGQIISDLKQAVLLLPVQPLVQTRPSKPAAFGALARVYLAMGDYTDAKADADSCLRLFPTLIDYNTLNPAACTPFERFNAEVIFHATSSGRGAALSPSRARVDTSLYQSYAPDDLRKQLFYKAATNGLQEFKGDYSGQNYGELFDGVATDEVLLIRSECNARLGDAPDAIKDLNLLLQNRYATGTYIPYPAGMNTDSALALVIQERRKELAFRGGIRWSDLRRYSGDSRFAVTPQRLLKGVLYTLAPGDKRYAFLLPLSVVQLAGISQNSR